IATDPPAGPVFVALPIDVLEQETDVPPFEPGRLFRASEPDPAGVQAAAALLRGARRPVIVVGDEAAGAAAEVTALAEELGAAVWCEGIHAHLVLPTVHPNFRLGLPFDAAAIRGALDGDAAIRANAARRNDALRALKAQDAQAQRARAAKRWEHVPISVPRLMAEIEAALPPDAIVVDEAITASLELARTVQFERTGDYIGARGGGIGQALPGALGVKLAHSDRPVVAFSGDGSA